MYCYGSQLCEHKNHIKAYLTSWRNGIFDYEVMRMKILKKLSTASHNSKFTGSFRKVQCMYLHGSQPPYTMIFRSVKSASSCQRFKVDELPWTL